jgi:hypothetical protein
MEAGIFGTEDGGRNFRGNLLPLSSILKMEAGSFGGTYCLYLLYCRWRQELSEEPTASIFYTESGGRNFRRNLLPLSSTLKTETGTFGGTYCLYLLYWRWRQELSEEPTASIFYPEDGGRNFRRNLLPLSSNLKILPVGSNITRPINPEDQHLNLNHHENLKSHSAWELKHRGPYHMTISG